MDLEVESPTVTFLTLMRASMASQVTGVCYFIPHLADKRGGGGLCRGSGMVWKVGGVMESEG